MYGVAAPSADDVWAVGVTGSSSALMEHWDGTAWAIVNVPTPGVYSFLYDIDAVSATDVWAVGDFNYADGVIHGLAEHWDGTAWTVVNVPDSSPYANVFNAVAATSSSDVWAVGYQQLEDFRTGPLTEHWDGTAWTVVPAAPTRLEGGFYGVDGSSPDDVWATGGGFHHWDGSSWNNVRPSGTGGPIDVETISATDAWAVGQYMDPSFHLHARSWHWDGSQWSTTLTPEPGNGSGMGGVTVLSSNDVWAFGLWSPRNFGGDISPLILHSTGPCSG